MKYTKQEIEEAKGYLKRVLKPGSVIYTTVTHVSQSGMSRVIDCYTITKNQPIWLSHSIARAIGQKLSDKHQGIKINGTGMDMGYHVVTELQYQLYGQVKGSQKTLKQRWL